jgi:hypothetical protein
MCGCVRPVGVNTEYVFVNHDYRIHRHNRRGLIRGSQYYDLEVFEKDQERLI